MAVNEPLADTLELALAVGRAGRRVGVRRYRWAAAATTAPGRPGEAPRARATVVIAHGAGEHGMRYSRLAGELASIGCSVVAFDQLGHGRTAVDHEGDEAHDIPDAAGQSAAHGEFGAHGRTGENGRTGEDGRTGEHRHRGGLGDLGEGGNRAALATLIGVLDDVRASDPETPIVLYGHSWGSLLAQRAFAARPGLVDGLVLSGTSLAVPGYLNPGNLNGPWRRDDPTGLQWLSRDPAARDAFANDPLCFDIAAQPVWDFVDGLRLVSLPPLAMAGRVDDVPVLIVAGSEDTVGYGRRGPTALARAYRRRSALSDVTLRIFEGARHEVINETNRDEVVATMTDWIAARFPAPLEPSADSAEGSAP